MGKKATKLNWPEKWRSVCGKFADRFISEMDSEGWWHRKNPFHHVPKEISDLYDIAPSGSGIKIRPK